MKIPFTVEQFFDVFAAYNVAVWPAPLVAYVLGIIAVVLVFREGRLSAPTISAVLSLFWIWMGGIYHLAFFSAINPAAWFFGMLFIFQGLLFILNSVGYNKLEFRFSLRPLPVIGACFIVYALVVYPLLGFSLGHAYPGVPLFGVAPCPTTIFTFGLLLCCARPVPVYLLVIPLLWSIVGMSAAISLHVPQDYGLVIAGVVGTLLILVQNRSYRRMVL
jgi:hypothetical protein